MNQTALTASISMNPQSTQPRTTGSMMPKLHVSSVVFPPLRWLAGGVVAALNAARHRAARGPGWSARGIPIRVAYVGKERKQYAQRVGNALALIAAHDPRRLDHIRRDLDGILVWPLVMAGATASYHPDDRLCALDSGWVMSAKTIGLALTTVHEATHARLARAPINTLARLERVEKICMRQERAFASRVPGSDALVHALEQVHSRPIDYSVDARARRGASHLAREGAGKWSLALIRLSARVAKRE